ncbi:MAG: hypothetical protein ACTTKO_03970 [Candidatus Limimorpha sp.]
MGEDFRINFQDSPRFLPDRKAIAKIGISFDIYPADADEYATKHISLKMCNLSFSKVMFVIYSIE